MKIKNFLFFKHSLMYNKVMKAKYIKKLFKTTFLCGCLFLGLFSCNVNPTVDPTVDPTEEPTVPTVDPTEEEPTEEPTEEEPTVYEKETGTRPDTTYVPITVNAAKMRTCYDFSLFNENDLSYYNFFKDTEEVVLDTVTLKCIYDGTYFRFLISESSSQDVKITYNDESITVNGYGVASFKLKNTIYLKDNYEFTLDCGEETYNLLVKAITNSNETSLERKLFSASYRYDNEISVDGIKDDIYLQSEVIPLTYLCQGSTSVTGNGYFVWDDEYIYAFYEIYDDVVFEYTDGTSTNFEKDACELWIDTCRTLCPQNKTWGDENRPYHDYIGEGAFKMRACASSIGGGTHWMWDEKSIYREGKSIKTDVGYNCEFKIGWATFGELENKVNQVISFGMLVIDGNTEQGIAAGKVGCNSDSNIIYNWGGPAHMDHLKLVK